ncbi:hypothetical protein PJF56_19175 [Roseofilum sp. BLCC_M91]|uniref:DUF1761 domain-containing protein n=1 Tax=Roseofilum halophilum BLCC-M91 TaxID=3022259 RepID=A0ABT7BP98_9CYAN|nr:hypothetical protein [Roseofilum halophilum]MDJ1180986.1 hypothetical protein [Roseofilum halophilum BLCC-M91]
MIADLILSMLITVAIAILGIWFAGLPGYFIIWLSQPFLRFCFGQKALSHLNPEESFAAIFLVSLFWGFNVLPGYLVAFIWLKEYTLISQIPIFVGVVYVGSIIVALVSYGWVMGSNEKP